MEALATFVSQFRYNLRELSVLSFFSLTLLSTLRVHLSQDLNTSLADNVVCYF